MQTIRVLDPKERLSCEHDGDADVLRVAAGEPGLAVEIEIADGVVVQYDPARREIVGLGVQGLCARVLQSLAGGKRPACRPVSSGRERELLVRIRDAVREVEADPEVILYGSRARGDARPDSDWDLLVLVDGPVTRERDRTINDRLFRLSLEAGEVIGAIVHSRADWNSPLYRAMPFHAEVSREGISL